MRERERSGGAHEETRPEPSLTTAVAGQRERVSALEERLAPRRRAEAAELEALAREQHAADRRTNAATRSISEVKENLVALEERRRVLEQGLSQAHRSWLRVGEPVLGGLLLLSSFIIAGLALNHHLQMLGFEALGFLVGTLIALRRRR